MNAIAAKAPLTTEINKSLKKRSQALKSWGSEVTHSATLPHVMSYSVSVMESVKFMFSKKNTVGVKVKPFRLKDVMKLVINDN